MKILFIVTKKDLPSSRVRVLNLLPELARAGIDAKVILYPRSVSEKLRVAGKLGRYDLVVVQKKLPSFLDLMILRGRAKKLAYDFDDAVYCNFDESKGGGSRAGKFKRMTRASDLVIAGNRLLAEKALLHNRNVMVVPSAVPCDGIPVKNSGTSRDRTVIGWVGISANFPYLQILTPVLARLSLEFPITFKVLSNEPPHMPGVPVDFVPWTLEGQEAEIAAFDIGVMPLPRSRYSEGKCGYKALQYMAAEVPPVVSDVGVNSEIVEHGKDGIVAKTLDDFYDAIKYLIENSEARRMMGLRARKKVERVYSIQVVGTQLGKALLELQEV